jgi:hypothetical protein
MGSSYTEFRDKGFWSYDGLLEVWLRLLSLHFKGDVYTPGWQQDLRDHWLWCSGVGINGCIVAALDEFLTDEERIGIVIEASDRCAKNVKAFGKSIPAVTLNLLGLEGQFNGDIRVEWVELIAERFSALLRGELTTDAKTSPVLPFTRHGQTWDELEKQ